jgi:hypothetical protein
MRGLLIHLEIEMLNSTIQETSNMLAAQSRLFINVEIAMEVYRRDGNCIPSSDISYAQSDVWFFRNAMYAQQDRFYAWRERHAAQRSRARARLDDRLQRADQVTRPYDPNSLGHAHRLLRLYRTACRRPFAELAEAVRAAIKAARVGDRAGQREGKQRLIELAYNCTYTTLVYEVIEKHWHVLRIAVRNAQYRFDTGHWKAPVWVDGGWTDRHPAHFVHASRETPGNVAFYPDADKLEADKLTSMKPGRYLSAFYGDVLSAEEIKQWANKQQVLTAPVELKFVGNDDPLGWVWVYENSTPSCMRYNRSNRYINAGLKGDKHPVTVYAHPENNLALAYIMLPGEVEDRTRNCRQDEHVVGARAIVNTQNKTYLRIYGAGDVQYTSMKEVLERAGYTHSGSTLRNEKLRLEAGVSGYLCPYLDGNYPYVKVHSSHLMVCEDGVSAHETSGYVCEDGVSAHETSGYVCEDEYEGGDHCYCNYCESSRDEENGSYVASVGEWVCDDCIDENFVCVLGRHGGNELHRDNSEDIIYCEYDGNYYVTEYLSANGMGMTADGVVYPEDQLVETGDGVYHTDDAVELTYAYNDYGWARRDSVCRLSNGETCHVDDADKIAEIEALEQEAA